MSAHDQIKAAADRAGYIAGCLLKAGLADASGDGTKALDNLTSAHLAALGLIEAIARAKADIVGVK